MIHQSDMTTEQNAAVVAAIAHYLTAPTYDGPADPIVAGEMKCSRSGAPWVRFGNDTRCWYRYMDVPGLPARNYAGGEIVLDDEGRPLGNSDGPLVIHRVSGRWTAQPINTGWNLDHEIVWEG